MLTKRRGNFQNLSFSYHHLFLLQSLSQFPKIHSGRKRWFCLRSFTKLSKAPSKGSPAPEPFPPSKKRVFSVSPSLLPPAIISLPNAPPGPGNSNSSLFLISSSFLIMGIGYLISTCVLVFYPKSCFFSEGFRLHSFNGVILESFVTKGYLFSSHISKCGFYCSM